MIGVEFTLKDGSKDSYDPVDPDKVIETEYDYKLFVGGGGGEYQMLKSDISSIRYYDLCEACGHEVPGYCRCEPNE
jgi:hypothetical protein